MVYSEKFCKRTLTHLLKDFGLGFYSYDETIKVMCSRDWYSFDQMVDFLKTYHFID